MTYRNDNIVEILQLSYENENSTARWHGHRSGTQAFLRSIYTETLLDAALADDIEGGEFDLVVITGNPGDGKTAFLDHLANRGRTRDGRPVEILHDATQPQDDNRAALAKDHLEYFLRDLTDEHWQPDTRRVRVIGINEGMLARTLLDPQGPFRDKLRLALRRPDRFRPPPKSVLVNLNERALVHLPLGSGRSLLARLVERLTDRALWEDGSNGQGCAGCPAESVCPLLANARLLRLTRPRRQLEILFGVVQFQRQRHVALRDALAALAYLIVGHEDMYRSGASGRGRPRHPCDYIQERAAEERWGHLYRRLFYHAACNDGDIFEGYFDELGEEAEERHRLYGFGNRFVAEQLGAVDPVNTSNAALDQIDVEVVSNPVGVLTEGTASWMADLMDLERRFLDRLSERLREIDGQLTAGEVADAEFEGLREAFLRLAYVAARAARRRAFFFDATLADGDTTPYQSLQEFFDVLDYLANNNPQAVQAFERAVESTIPGGVVASERIPVPDPIETLQVRLGDARGSIGARLDFHVEEPTETLLLPKRARIDDRHDYRLAPRTERYVEYFPTFVVYRPFRDGAEHLLISLDVYELLYRLRNGFSEAFGGQRRVQQLQVFKAALKARPSRRLTLFDEERENVQVRVDVRGDGAAAQGSLRVRFQ